MPIKHVKGCNIYTFKQRRKQASLMNKCVKLLAKTAAHDTPALLYTRQIYATVHIHTTTQPRDHVTVHRHTHWYSHAACPTRRLCMPGAATATLSCDVAASPLVTLPCTTSPCRLRLGSSPAAAAASADDDSPFDDAD